MSSEETVKELVELSAEAASEAGVEIHTYELLAPANLEYFEGHFDGNPILAAVVQLEVMVLPRVEALWPDLGPVQRATKMKFRSPIRADERFRLQLVRKQGKKTVRVSVRRDDVECTSGSLAFS